MKIKHWQGYGCIDAKKISLKTTNNQTTLHIRVTGNHECGIHRDDEYDLFNWLVKRFDKSLTDYLEWHKRRPQIQIKDDYSTPVDTCDYIFVY